IANGRIGGLSVANTDATTLGEGPDLLIPGMDEEGEKLVNKQPDTQLAEAEEKQKYGTSRADRETSYQLADFPVLTGEEEDWRFTPPIWIGGLSVANTDATTLGEGPDLLIPGMDEEGEKLVNKQPDTQLAEAEEKQKYGTSRADRETSYQLADFPVLTGEEEDWRFTP